MISPDLKVTLQASTQLLMLVMAAHVVAVLALIVLNTVWAWLLIVVVLLSAIYYFVQIKSPKITAIDVGADSYRVHYQGVWQSVQLRSAFITAPLTVMHFVSEQGRAYYLTVLSDSLPSADYRHLRIRLRYKA